MLRIVALSIKSIAKGLHKTFCGFTAFKKSLDKLRGTGSKNARKADVAFKFVRQPPACEEFCGAENLSSIYHKREILSSALVQAVSLNEGIVL